ncbi:hypothetical protein F5Y10DRAFT_293055 [Nemania abortiva]|nr:hypothetical protein F5Y10DRAFT_293055 [Nemania abortiva]
MTPDHPPSTPIPAPPLNIVGWTCTGTACGSEVKYVCQKVCSDYAGLTKYEFEHLIKPQFWILAVLILYIVSETYSEDSYQLILRLLAKLRPGSANWPQPRSRLTQIAALLVYLGILWLVWIEASMVLSTDWRMARKVFVVWQPRLTPWRLRLFILYPIWVIASALCITVIAATLLAGAIITKIQISCVTEMALLVMGRKALNDNQLSHGLPRENGNSGYNFDKKLDEANAMKTSKAPSGNSQV